MTFKKLNFKQIHPFDHCAGYFLLAAATAATADALGQSTLFHFIVAVDAPMHDVRTTQHYSYQKYTHSTTVQDTALFQKKKLALTCAQMSALLMILVTARPLVTHARKGQKRTSDPPNAAASV